MTRLTVEIDDFVAAARTMHDDVGEPVRRANARLVDTLAGCGSMAGDDDGGRTWATAYDDAAESVLIATSRVAAAAFQTATLFGHSATNYARAEAASTTSGPGSPAHLVQGLPPAGTVGRVAAPPSAAGGGGDEPSGWGLIKNLVGYAWPNGHQDRLRRSAHAYRHCANVLESVAIEPAAVSMRFLSDRLPEADDVNTVCGGLAERIRSLGDAHRTLARSCDELADHIDHCHSEIESELSSLAIESGALQVAGAIASVFTLGGAEVPTQVAQAARIAAVAAKVAEIIRRFIAAARVLDAAIPPVAHAALSITQALDKLAHARAATANVTTVPRLDRQNMVAGRGETAATGRLANGRVRATDVPLRLRGRQIGDPGVWGNPRTLPVHFRDHGVDVQAVSRDDYATKASDFLQRALAEGFPRKIDGDGIIRVFDPSTGLFGSYRADGASRTIFRPTSPTYFERQPGVLQ